MTTPAPASDADSSHYASYGTQEAQYGDFTTYGGYDATGFSTAGTPDGGAHTTGTFETDPLFGNMPGDATGSYDASTWTTGGHQTLNYDMYAAQHHAAYDTGAYDTAQWGADHQQLAAIPPQGGSVDHSGQWDASSWHQPDVSAAPADQTQQWEWGTQSFDTGAYDATQWNSDGTAADQQQTATFEQARYDESQAYDETHAYDESHAYGEANPYGDAYAEHTSHDGESHADPDTSATTATGEMPAVHDAEAPLLDDQEEPPQAPAPAPGSRVAARNANRSRRRMPAKRSALLTIAVPSACVMGVAGIAAASVGTLTGDDKDTSTTLADTSAVKPSVANNKLDTQLESLSAGADDFADRASRTQERIDLKAQQVAEKKKAAEEAARKERLRPKFALPVAQRGLSAYYGQSGVNWMSVHTGIDFPVSYGTTVMAATDGTVRTQWNSAYGNMMVVTAKDGTETWYCHLSSYRVASGTTVKAGDPIAYSGNSGNSTGPHLHFEVHPAGGSAIDPLPWLRSHGLDPT
ncbi:M23 family metallopeptidase [Streptomyces sp. SAI-117]|uniref:M23 family metallopeptidase n=1 Tax=Streptomyces sp. SAI-117 TaxID=2940546 RepID=UPI00247632D8|nr:M23 family metallopeptidase [Streptomyces sp. SAI-117]